MCSRWYSTAVLPGGLVFAATYNSLQLQFACWAGYWEIWCSCTDRLSSVRLAERLNEIKGVQGALGSTWWWLPRVFLRDAREWELHGCFPSYMWHLSSQPTGNSTLATCAQRSCGYQIFKKCRNFWSPAWKWFHETEMWSVRMSEFRCGVRLSTKLCVTPYTGSPVDQKQSGLSHRCRTPENTHTKMFDNTHWLAEFLFPYSTHWWGACVFFADYYYSAVVWLS